MSFLAPLWFAVAGAAALGAIALHFITTQRPPASPLPTARFVPQGNARASSRAARPTDLLLLVLRCAAVLLLGTAFAGPVTLATSTLVARVILVDRSRGALADVRDSALAVTAGSRARGVDALVLFDSSATVFTAGVQDSLRAYAAIRAQGSLSTALVAARRAAGDLALRADSVELVIVSPLTTDELDAASAGTFARWPGRARLVRTTAARPVSALVTLAGDDADDALRPTIAALNADAARGATRADVRVVRRAPSAADSSVARGGVALVAWPPAGATAARGEGVWAGRATLVAPLARLAIPVGGRVVARWADGARAAAEWPLGGGCIRAVGIGVPPAGDVALQPAFMALARVLLAPCAGANVVVAAPDSVARAFTRLGAAATSAALRPADERSPLAPWLVGAALLLLVGELFVRRRGTAVAA